MITRTSKQEWVHPSGSRLTITRTEDDLYAEPQMSRWPKVPKENPHPPVQVEVPPPSHPANWLSILCLFFATGRTFTFRDVFIEVDNENEFRFSYQAMSDGKVKRASFSKFHVVGISRTR